MSQDNQLVLTSPEPKALTPMELLERAVAQNLDLEKLKGLFELQERWEKNQARKAFVEAMNEFKKNPPRIVKDKTATIRSKKGEGSSFSYKYAALDSMCAAIVEGLSTHGISHRWTLDDSTEGSIKVTCILTHELGHSEETSMRGPVMPSEFINPLQSRSVTVSYLERYTLMASTGLAATEEGIGDGAVTNGELEERLEAIADAGDVDVLATVFKDAYKLFTKNQAALKILIAAKDKRKQELTHAN
jgi:hypothetical protein